MKKPPQQQFIYSENKVAARLGLAREVFKYLRDIHLEKDLDWINTPTGIALTLVAVKKIWRAMDNAPQTLDVSSCLVLEPEEKKTAPAQPEEPAEPTPAPIKLHVLQVPPNPYILIGVDAVGNKCYVRVPSNANFTVGLEFSATPSLNVKGYFELVGRPPRERGRW